MENDSHANMALARHDPEANAAGASSSESVFNANPTHAYTNGHANYPLQEYVQQQKGMPHQAPVYRTQTGEPRTLSRPLTAGGHFADDDLIAIANNHRKIANPLPLGGKFPHLPYLKPR